MYNKKKAKLFREARDNLKKNADWTLAQTLFGVTTHYRREDDGSLSIKLEGEMSDVPLFEPVCVLREIDLHCTWAPCVTSSLTIAHLDKVDTVGWIMIGLPNFGLARDGVFRAIGTDSTMEDGSIYLFGQGVQDTPPGKQPINPTFLNTDPELETLDIPPAPTRMGSGRLTIRKFEARVEVLSPDHCKIVILANVDPNLAFIPQSLIEFVMKKMCGFIVHKLKKASVKVSKNPVRNIHAQRIREDSDFYAKWLLPKFEAMCNDRGWEMPTVKPLNLTSAQQAEAERLEERGFGKTHSFGDLEDANFAANSNFSIHSEPGATMIQNLPPGGTSASDNGDDENRSTDNISEISSVSGTSSSVWRNNPIATYLRDMEQKTQERKAQKVIQARLKARKRLKPKPRPASSHQRLKELKMRKRQRQRCNTGDGTIVIPQTNLPAVRESCEFKEIPDLTEKKIQTPVADFLQFNGQDKWKRKMVLAVLLFVLNILLHLDKKILPLISPFGKPWWFQLLGDVITLVYIAICGACHFLLGDMMLVYVFEEFELGMKSGEHMRQFYKGKVRMATFFVTVALVGFSLGKGVLIAMIRNSAVLATRASRLVFAKWQEFEGFGTIEDKLPESLVDVYRQGHNIFATLITYLCIFYNWQMDVFVRSHSYGRAVENFWIKLYNVLTLEDPSLEELGGTETWREDTAYTLRWLLLCTSVFGLAMLLFLNMFAKTYRHKEKAHGASIVGSSIRSVPTTIQSGATPTGRSPVRMASSPQ